MEYAVVSTIDWYNLKTFARLALQYFYFYEGLYPLEIQKNLKLGVQMILVKLS